jgi:hypothetical protein
MERPSRGIGEQQLDEQFNLQMMFLFEQILVALVFITSLNNNVNPIGTMRHPLLQWRTPKKMPKGEFCSMVR